MTTVASSNVITGNRKNYIINSDFKINQRAFAGGALADTDYGYDRWKAGGASDMSATDGVLTIVSGTAIQVVEDFGYTGDVTISWEGTSTVNGVNTSPYTYTKIAGNDTLTFEPGTLSKVKMEIGSSPSDYDYPDPASELAKCQRYYFGYVGQFILSSVVTTEVLFRRSYYKLPVPMRVTPTVSNITASNGVPTAPFVDKDGVTLNSDAATTSSTVFINTFNADAEL